MRPAKTKPRERSRRCGVSGEQTSGRRPERHLTSAARKIKVRAERRAGEMLAEMEKHKGGRPNGNRSHDATGYQTLDDLGINKSQSSRWQKLAAVPESQFEKAVEAPYRVGDAHPAALP